MPQRKVGKRKRLKPLLLSGHCSLPGVVVHLESVFVHLHTPVTRASYFRRRCARRSVLHKTTRYVLVPTSRHRGVARHRTDTSFEVGFPRECRGTSPRRSRRPPRRGTEAGGFLCRPVRDARSSEWELMSPLSLTRNVREHGFQMHHYPQQTTVPT